MKSLLVGYSLFVACCFVGVISQRVSDFEPSGRRGDVLSLGDIGDQTVFNVDNSGGKGGDSSGGKGGDHKGPLDCVKINHDCQCFAQPIYPNPTGQYQMDYDSYSDGYHNG